MAVPCPLCSSATTSPWFEKDGCTVCRCTACGVAFTAGEWSPATARAFYGEAYFAGHDPIGYSDYAALEDALRATAEARLRRLPSGGRLLDIGCGPGVFVGVARQGFRAVGSDVSVFGCRTARSRGLDVVVNSAEALPFADGSFDVVTMWDTIEHLANPAAALRDVARILRPGGLLVFSTGDVESWCARLSGRYWHLFTLPEHRFFFSRATLERLATGAGLEVRASYHAGARYSVAYLLERIVKSLGGTTRRLAAGLRRPWLNRTVVPVNLFDIITVEATKPANRHIGDASNPGPNEKPETENRLLASH